MNCKISCESWNSWNTWNSKFCQGIDKKLKCFDIWTLSNSLRVCSRWWGSTKAWHYEEGPSYFSLMLYKSTDLIAIVRDVNVRNQWSTVFRISDSDNFFEGLYNGCGSNVNHERAILDNSSFYWCLKVIRALIKFLTSSNQLN